jgi:inosine/xanthosine triphosphatase
MIVAVGSKNKTKIAPVAKIFSKYFHQVRVVGVSVPSGVSNQPMDDAEMYRGAFARANKALASVSDAEYGVGIEGGVDKRGYGWFESSLVVIINKQGDIGVGTSGGLVLPDKVIQKIHEGKTLEQAVDELFGTHEIGEGIGMFGLFTNKVVTRSSGVSHGVAFALARFLHEEVYR